MSEQREHDETVLIDFLLGQCDRQSGEAVKSRLATDPSFRQLHDNINNALSALRLVPQVEPPEDLVERTMARIDSARRTEALIARQGMDRRVLQPTFSLREVTAIAAVVLLMALIVIPSVRRARQVELASRCRSQAGQIGSAILTYTNAHNDHLPGACSSQTRWLPAEGEPSVSNSVGLFRLIRSGYASPVLFQCPAVGGKSFVVQAGMTDFPNREHITYSYQHMLGPDTVRRSDPSLSAVAGKMAILADRTPVFRNGKFQPDRVRAAAGDNHGGRGQNVLYLDMHVEWAPTPGVGVGGNNIFLADGIYDYNGDEAPASMTDTFLLPAYSARLKR